MQVTQKSKLAWCYSRVATDNFWLCFQSVPSIEAMTRPNLQKKLTGMTRKITVCLMRAKCLEE
jgi:hypothetical protein